MSTWVCATCHSINGPRHDACYSCRADRYEKADDPGAASNAAAIEPNFLYTGVVYRAIAWGIDMAILGTPWALAFIGLGGSISLPMAAVGLAVSAWMYFAVGWGEFGTTLGMRLFRIRIVRARDGQTIGLARGFVRVVVFVATTILVPVVPAVVPMVIDRKRRALHDHAAGNVVIRPAPVRAEAPAPRGPEPELLSARSPQALNAEP